MAIGPRLPRALRGELGVKDKQRRPTRKPREEREPRKKRKLYQPQSDEDVAVQTSQRSAPSKRGKIAVPKSQEDRMMDLDDAEIDYWEAKLGQKKGAVADELDDGLDDIFAGLDLPRGVSKLEEVTDEESGSEGDMQDFLDDEEGADVPDLVTTVSTNTVVNNADDFTNFDEEDTEAIERNARPSIYKPYTAEASGVAEEPLKPTAYVPPALRNKTNADTTQLKRQLKGLINRLSAVNISTIVSDIEAMYRSNPRGSMNDELATLLLDVVADKAGLLDSFVVLHAAFLAALYKLNGIDFAASFVQRLVEAILALAGTEITTGRKAINLMTLTSELYNLNVIAATLPYDFVRSLLSNLNELNVEVLLVIIRSAGSQLRSDDPSSLKDILTLLQSEMKLQYTDKEKEVPQRMKFMVESLMNLKNNKVSTAESQQAKELRTRMRKYIGGLTTRAGQSAGEPLRVSLADIQNVETRGKWWLVGASWRNQADGTVADDQDVTSTSEAPKQSREDETQQEELLALAKQHRLNNPIRKQIFITILSASDYLEAITSVLSLRLKKSQESEIARVLVLLVGSEERYNPYYTHIAKGLSDRHGMRISLQFCLWDFLRDCGESEVGQIGHDDEDDSGRAGSEAPSIRKSINVAKFFGTLMGQSVMPLTVLKTLTFARLQGTTKRFLDVLMTELFLSLHAAATRTTSAKSGATARKPEDDNVVVVGAGRRGKRAPPVDSDYDRRVGQVFGQLKSFDATHGTNMVKGVDWFLRKVVVHGGSVVHDDNVAIVKEGIDIARIVMS